MEKEVARVSRSQAVFRDRSDAIDTDHSGVISRTELKDKLIKDDVLEKILRMKMDLTRRMESSGRTTSLGISSGHDGPARGRQHLVARLCVEGVAQVRSVWVPRRSAQLEVNRAGVSHPLHRSELSPSSVPLLASVTLADYVVRRWTARLPHHRPQPHGLREPRRVPHQVAKG